MNLNTYYFSNYTFTTTLKENLPAFSIQQKVILGIVLAALSFIATVFYSNYFQVNVEKAPSKVEISEPNHVTPEENHFISVRESQNKEETEYPFLKHKDSVDILPASPKNEEPLEMKEEPKINLEPKKVIQEDTSKRSETIKVANQILEDLYESQTDPKYHSKLKDFSFSIYHPQAIPYKFSETTPPLWVKFKSGGKESTLPLMTILRAIQWNKLDSKWGKDHSYLKSYTSLNFCSMNLFLREGKILLGLAKSSTADAINKAAKDQLFACLSASGSLTKFPSAQTNKVYRNVKSCAAPYLMNKYEEGTIVTEESFLSTITWKTPTWESHFPGDIEYQIKLAPHSQGRYIASISNYHCENECLFFPFTPFKVEKVKFLNKATGSKVDIQTLIENPQKILDINIKKIIELSEVPSD